MATGLLRSGLVLLLVGILVAVHPPAPPAASAAECVAVPHDDWGRAAELDPGLQGALDVDTCGAGSEPGEPASGRGDSLWFRWRAPHDQWMLFTHDYGDGLLVRAFTGTSVAGLTEVGTGSAAYPSAPHLRVRQGATYWIQVTSTEGDQRGRLQWRHTPAQNDHSFNAPSLPSAAQPPTARRGTHLVDNVAATAESVDPPLASGQSGRTLWWTMTPQVRGTVTVDLSGSEVDTVVGLFRRAADGSLSRVAVAQGGGTTAGAAKLVAQVAGGTARYAVVVDSMDGAEGGIDLRWRLVHPRPANDHFGDARVLRTATGTSSSWLFSATRQRAEPAHNGVSAGRTVWWTLVAPRTGRVTVGTGATRAFAAYRGSSLYDLRRVRVERQQRWPRHAMSYLVRRGHRVHVAVGTDPDNPAGPVGLEWSIAPVPPANDDRADARTITGRSGSLTQSTVGATAEPEQGESSTQASVWFRWRATHTGWERFTTDGSLAATGLRFHPTGTDWWAHVFGDGHSDLYSYQAFPGRYAAQYARVVEGRVYDIRLHTPVGKENTVALQWSRSGPPGRPANDDLASARSISGSTGTVADQRYRGATYQPGESLLLDECGGCGWSEGAHGASVWYRWTAPASGTVRFQNDDNGAGAWLSLYSGGGTVGALEPVGEPVIGTPNRAYGGTTLDRQVTAGTTYHLRYSENTGDGEPVTLRWSLTSGTPGWPAGPSNDDVADAVVLTGPSGTAQGTDRWSTLEPGEPNRVERPLPWSVWYRWTAPASGRLTVGTGPEDSSALVNVYAGTPGSLSLVPPLGVGQPDRRPTVEVTQGQTYRVQVGLTGGPFALSWDTLPPPNDDVADAALLDPGPRDRAGPWNLATATAEPGERPNGYGQEVQRSVWASWTPTHSGKVSMTVTGDGHARAEVFTGDPPDGLTVVAPSSHVLDFEATAGTRYLVRVEGLGASLIGLAWDQRWDVVRPRASMVLAGGAASTTSLRVPLLLRGSDGHSGLRGWRVSFVADDTDVHVAAWVPAGDGDVTVAWPLTHTAYGGRRGTGTRTVHVQAEDRAGNLSLPRSATIRLE